MSSELSQLKDNCDVSSQEEARVATKFQNCFVNLIGCKTRSNIGKVETPISVRKGDKCYTINLLVYCIFCFRKVKPKETSSLSPATKNLDWNEQLLREVPLVEATSGPIPSMTLLKLLNKTWNQVQQGGNWNWQEETEDHLTEFSRLPTICAFCMEKMDGIYQSFNNLMAEINQLGIAIRESKCGGEYSWRVERFQEAIRSSSVANETLELLGLSQGKKMPRRNEESDPEEVEEQQRYIIKETKTAYSRGETQFIDEGSDVSCQEDDSVYVPANEDYFQCREGQGQDGFHETGLPNKDVKVEVPEEHDNGTTYEGFTNPMTQTELDSSDGEGQLGRRRSQRTTKTKSLFDQTNFSDDDGSVGSDLDCDEINNDSEYTPEEDEDPLPKIKNDGCASMEISGEESDGTSSEAPSMDSDKQMNLKVTGSYQSIRERVATKVKNVAPTWTRHRTLPVVKTYSTYIITTDPMTKKHTFTCTIAGCGRAFATNSSRQYHQIRIHQAEKFVFLKCPHCCVKYTSRAVLRKHRQGVHNTDMTSHVCDLCKERVLLKVTLEHARAHVGNEFVIKCPNFGNCSRVFCTAAGLLAHLNNDKMCRDVISNGEEKHILPTYICEVCAFEADNVTLLRRHLFDNHENRNGTEKISCPVDGCQEQFSLKQSVLLHIPAHAIHDDSEVPCDVCAENVKLGEMEHHLKTTHLVEVVIRCLHCPLLFATREDLIDHLYEHRDNALFCDICGENGPSFLGYNYLYNHYAHCHRVGSLHENVSGNAKMKGPRSSCKFCKVTFPNMNTFRRHVQKLHPQVKICPSRIEATRVCDLCKVRVSLSDMRDHVLHHLGEEYLVRCPNTGNCDRVFCTPWALSRHLVGIATCGKTLSVEDLAKYKEPHKMCEVCGYKSKTQMSSLRSHLLRHHESGPRQLSCPIQGCEQRFCVRQSVVLHIYRHIKDNKPTGDNVQVCSECQEKVNTNRMEQHLKSRHECQDVIKCPYCQYLFPSRDYLVNHLYVHRRESLFCDICGKEGQIFARHHYLRKHYFSEHQIGSKFTCDKCNKVFYSQKPFDIHVTTLDQNTQDPPKKAYPCTKCSVVYMTRNSLQTHEIREHGANLLPCGYCNQRFSSANVLNRHEQKHRRFVREKEFPCPVPGCKQIFSTNRTMKYHLSVIHEGMKHICELCGKSYLSKGSLDLHVRIVHMGLRPFMCDVCGESFSTNPILNRHKRIHTEERPFACEICGQRFRQVEALKPHLKSHKEKGAGFKPSGAMKHIRKRVERKK